MLKILKSHVKGKQLMFLYMLVRTRLMSAQICAFVYKPQLITIKPSLDYSKGSLLFLWLNNFKV